jgi:TetR/AcrR family transcriptional repressor of nem operon
MTTKGERTRQRVVELVAPVFNTKGYWGSSLRDVMDATGLEKGGIYNHFRGKDDLALAAFEHNASILRAMVREALAGRRHAVDRLVAIIDAYRRFADDPPIPGGCPLLNTAVEADDSHPLLRDRVCEVLEELHTGTIARIVERGLERGEIAPGTDPQRVATVVVATLEGSLMLRELYRDPVHVHRAADHLATYVRGLAAPAPEPGEPGADDR